MHVGQITTTPTNSGIWVSAAYSGDTENSSTLKIYWKLSSDPSWPVEPQYALPHAPSPYIQKITGLANGTSYDVRVEFIASAVTGQNPKDFRGLAPSRAIHNSDNATLNDTKWQSQGGWGIPGGKYGQFDCDTCHQRNAPNIKRIKGALIAPDGDPFPVGNGPVSFLAVTGFGDDSDNHTASAKVCEVCHSQTDYHRYDTTGQPVKSHYNNVDCIQCHLHKNGFAHGASGGAGCGTATTCHGTIRSHQTHVNNAGGKGLALACSECHDTNNFPGFKDGQNLANTTACNACHSPGGTYDGVNNAAFGAKNNWISGVYDGNSLKAGREKWCASCHDESPSVITGVTAPRVIGDESGAYTYGTGWGFYKTGHGLPPALSYPASGGVTAGAGLGCGSCHDFSTAHIDNNERTFGCGDGCDAAEYRTAYRLKLVDGQAPMQIPLTGAANDSSQFRLCYSCHNSGPFTNASNMNTDLVTDGVNRHQYHLSFANQLRYPADYDYAGTINSRITCVACHNVHGSTRLAMVNDGKLTGREPGLQYWYYNPDIVSFASPPDTQPTPADLPLAASNGTVWSGGSSGKLCSHCHGNNWLTTEARTPFQNIAQGPVLSWAGTAGYEADGVDPDTAGGGSNFIFRVKYTDGNNDVPAVYQVWIDKNDNGIYDADEKIDMAELEADDHNRFDGKVYTIANQLSKQGDNSLGYRFYFRSGADEATGAPASDHQVAVTNNAPVLSWTEEVNYVHDGVHPNTGVIGSSFTFRVKYQDPDNESPDADGVRVVIDGTTYLLDPETGGGYGTGKIYSKGITLSALGDLNYHFTAKDSTGASATGEAATVHVVTVAESLSNTPPGLEWDSAACLTEGVRPGTGVKDGDFEFRVKYTDTDSQCASSIQVTVNGTPYDLTDNDGASCLTGRTYYSTIALSAAGDFSYSFSASDGIDSATGAPTSNHIVSVIDTAYRVRPAGGAGWYSDLATAYNATPASGKLLVYPNADFTAATFAGGLSNINKTNRTLQAVCGPDLTIISGGTNVITLQGNDGAVIDGFTITGGTAYGIYSNSDSLTVRNSRISANPTGIHLNNGCNPVSIQNSSIYSNTSYGINSPSSLNLVSITDSTIYNNGGGATNGAGISYNGGAGTHTITGSSLTGNTTTGNGGALYCVNCAVSIDDSIITNNKGGAGGALYFLNAGVNATITDTFIQGNKATSTLGGAIYIGAGTESLTNVMLTGNRAGTNGGALYINGGTTECLFCTISGNYAGSYGGALYQNSSTQTNIRNSIIYNNNALNGGNYKQVYATSPRFTYVDVFTTLIAQIPGANISGPPDQRCSYEDNGGNLTAGDPHFVTPIAEPITDSPAASGDFHLQAGSPAINTGSSGYTYDHDIFGSARPFNGAYDMGAHEYRP